jgi:glutaredoxin 2
MIPFINDLSPGRREVKKLTGNYWVPVLVKDDGEVVQGSREIADWARSHPPSAAPSSATSPSATPPPATAL